MMEPVWCLLKAEDAPKESECNKEKYNMHEALHFLLVEDMPADAELARHEIRKLFPDSVFLRVETREDFLEALASFTPDVIISDYSMPQFDGMTALTLAIEKVPDIPIIMLTGSINEDTAVACMKAGAWDYVIKGHNKRLGPAVQSCLSQKQVRLDRRLAEAERELLKVAIEQASETITITDTAGVIQYVNPMFENVTGYSREEVIGQTSSILKSGKQESAFYENLWSTITAGKVWQGRMINKRKGGELYTVSATISPVRDTSGKIVNFVAVKRDITERLRLEEQFQQAQKMESVGRLAGGVAHDFNNMLSVIMGFTEMALDKSAQDDPRREDLQEVLAAAKRSSSITRQLLAFARKQTIAPQVLDLNETMEDMLKMLRRLVGEDINLDWQPTTGLWPVLIDPSQLDQILANLCVNARDAIKGVGKITIQTAMKTFDQAYCRENSFVTPGDYVMLAVSDDGCGMDENIQKKVFEPFFTTKEAGKGTGLGLATVYGIVKQNNCFIKVYSEPGQGTTFKIFFPRCGLDTRTEAGQRKMQLSPGQGESVLLVEDEAAILRLSTVMLRKLGYKVMAANTVGEALAIADNNPGEINLLITDVIMPEMNGPDLSKRLQARFPKMKTLFMSGHTSNTISHLGLLHKGLYFLQKPFSIEEMATKVRQVLGDKEDSEA
jgi:two-component system cell cycle sensor histidine kinase/response regulator CckA